MSEEHQLPSDSDEDDEDYVPDGVDNELSEAESEGEAESGPEDENDENKQATDMRKEKKRSKGRKNKTTKRKRCISRKSQENQDADEESSKPAPKPELTEEEEKKKADSLWADFMKDTGIKPTPKLPNSSNGSQEKTSSLQKPKIEEKIKITKIFEFAGEEVKVEKEVPVDSAEARLSLSTAENSTKSSESPSDKKVSGRGRTPKRGGLGGISSVLGQIGKKAKISTLEKSKMDWDSYKKEENLEEEISTHNKGKDGYLERQDFLQRADLRRFEIEKQLRNVSRRSTR